MKTIFAFLFACLLIFQPFGCLPSNALDSKDIDLDISNPQIQHKEFIKPYVVKLRKKIEAQWDSYDPRIGKTVKIFFLVARTGEVTAIQNINNDEPQLQGLAAYAIVNAAPFGVIPDHINALQITGTFRSKPPPIVIDKQKVKNALIDAAIVAGFAALTSFAIYALVKTANNNSNRNYYPASMYQPATLGGAVNPNWHQVSGYRKRNGTWVNPYPATNPDGTPTNNYSFPGNRSPWQ